MGKGQRKVRCAVTVVNSNRKIISSIETNTAKRKNPKKEFQGKLSHASPNTRITRYLQPQVNGDLQHLSPPLTAKPTLRNSRDMTIVKVMQESNAVLFTESNAISLCTESNTISVEENEFPQPESEDLPLLSHRKSVNISEVTHTKLPFQMNKKTVKSKKRPNGLALPKDSRAPPLTEFKASSDNNRKLTEYFPVRRSARRTKKVVLEEKQRHLEEAVISKCEEGLQVRIFQGKGRGVVATRVFRRGEFVVEYLGELISLEEAKKREQLYAHDQNTGCYMYYFKHNNIHHCVDATAESDKLGRLVNHSRFGNLITKTVVVDNQPHLVLIAKEDIQPGDEITYDYGDRSKESLHYHPWLAS